MDEQRAIERITETENLTDGLEDADANWLLDWGIGHVHDLLQGIQDDDVAGEKIHTLMAVMRKLNQITADRAAKPPKALSDDIKVFVSLYRAAFGQTRRASAAEYEQTAGTIAARPPVEAMQALISLASTGKPAAWSVPGDPDRKDSSIII